MKKVIEHTLLPFGDTVTVLSRKEVKNYADYYRDNDVKMIVYKRPPGKIGTLLCGLFNKDVFDENFDLFCVHYVTNSSVSILPYLKRKSKKTIFFFWGSDLLKATNNNKISYLMRICAFRCLDRISVGTNEMLDKFHELYGYSFDSKIRRIYFGANGIETLRNIKTDQNILRQKYNIDEKKIVIAIGYNKMTAQQHIKVITSINALPMEQRNHIHLILRLTYGNGDQKYIDDIKKSIDATGCSSSIFESYLTDEEVAEITSVTDIFVQAQVTDARSASMQEHLFAKCLVINPSWIHYSELEDKVFYLTYDNFEELTDIIQENMFTKEDCRYREYLCRNTEVISEISSWDAFVPAWRDIYLN